ncbi:outer membrane protein assembly factor BamD [candidate division KSB1 bacterium]|nr:outer membrane protein assembly factor BamD [candidate division KSB1 bacterium]
MIRRLAVVIFVLILIASCGSNKPNRFASPEERLDYAMQKFNKGDYLDAKQEFRIIVLNNPGHQIVDQAQFYLAESHFKMKEYILAAAEYEKLVKMLPNSSYVDDAQYKIGLCNFKLSPKYSLDQSYTKKTIDELQKFTEDYPDSDLKDDAIALIGQCRDKLALKDYRNAELYRTMQLYQAAAIYYEGVVNNYYDTKYAQDAHYWLAESLKFNGQYERAIEEFNKFLQRYPDSKRTGEVKNRIKETRSLQAESLKTENDNSGSRQ